jgi:hypothetical protein
MTGRRQVILASRIRTKEYLEGLVADQSSPHRAGSVVASTV